MNSKAVTLKTFEIGKTYIGCISGTKYYFVGKNLNGDNVFQNLSNKLLYTYSKDTDLKVKEYKEPEIIKGYVNIYRNEKTNCLEFGEFVHSSEESAVNEDLMKRFIDTIEISYTEGE